MKKIILAVMYAIKEIAIFFSRLIAIYRTSLRGSFSSFDFISAVHIYMIYHVQYSLSSQ